MESVGRSDERLRDDVIQELRWDSNIGKIQIGVQVDHGVVSLTGAVPSLATKIAAVRAVHRIRGVLDVADELEVVAPGAPAPNDLEVAQAVRHTLEWNVLVDDRKIRSTVHEGFVTLEGEVRNLRQREDAVHAIRGLKGVRGVIDKITVAPSETDPGVARRAIEEALERRAEREAERIKVSVEDGTVTLSGRVHSWAERDAIVGAVSHTPGISSVSDHLRIDPWF